MNLQRYLTWQLMLSKTWVEAEKRFWQQQLPSLLIIVLTILSSFSFLWFTIEGLALAYNDARSHLDIARRVVEGLKTGLAQLGSVWLPLPHILMLPFVWNDFFWHSGLAGALPSMVCYILTGLFIYLFLSQLKVSVLDRLVAVAIFALNVNVLYLQSTAMTELILIFTTTAASYYLLLWAQKGKLTDFLAGALLTFLATLTRYDGWFFLVWATVLVFIRSMNSNDSALNLKNLKKWRKNFSKAEGLTLAFATLAGFGVVLWFLWNLVIFKDPLYFAFGPYSAHAQQTQLEKAGELITKGNLWFSLKTYAYALFYNSYTYLTLLAIVGCWLLLWDSKLQRTIKLASTLLLAPLAFNILALFLGHSVLFIQGINGNTWFNVRYGLVMLPSLAIFIGYLISKLDRIKWALIISIGLVIGFSLINLDAVTIDDARVGASQKNVTEVSSWLNQYTKNQPGFILISAASHDAIIFSSGLPMKKFIHEGTGLYWEQATAHPEKWARWIVMRTYDDNDQTYRLIKNTEGFGKYRLVNHYPFASIYELREEYLSGLNTQPTLIQYK